MPPNPENQLMQIIRAFREKLGTTKNFATGPNAGFTNPVNLPADRLGDLSLFKGPSAASVFRGLGGQQRTTRPTPLLPERPNTSLDIDFTPTPAPSPIDAAAESAFPIDLFSGPQEAPAAEGGFGADKIKALTSSLGLLSQLIGGATTGQGQPRRISAPAPQAIQRRPFTPIPVAPAAGNQRVRF